MFIEPLVVMGRASTPLSNTVKGHAMKRITSSLLLAALLVTGSAAAANAAPAKTGTTAPISSTDRVGGWPF